MIKVIFLKSNSGGIGYEISGHAGYDVPGRDIICAAVSALHLSLLSVLEADGHSFDYDDDGDVKRLIIHSSEGQVFLRMFFVGIRCLEGEYPGYIEVFLPSPANR